MAIRINEDYLKENYRAIQKTCYTEGVPIPLLIDREANDDYVGLRYDDDEKKVFFDELDDERLSELEENMINRRTDVYGILQNLSPDYIDLNDYKETELKEWCRKYFQFNGVFNQI